MAVASELNHTQIHDPASDAGRLVLPEAGSSLREVATRASRVQIRSYVWEDLHEGEMFVHSPFIELTRIQAEGGYSPSHREWQPLGPVRLFAPGREFFSRWKGDQQFSLLCAFDTKEMFGQDFEIGGQALREACNVGNAHIHRLLIRLSQEMRQPGFASELVVETTAMALVAEIIQHFAQDRTHTRSRGEAFSAETIDRIGSRLREERRPPTIAELALDEGLSERQFARLFQAAAGESIGAFCARQVLLRSQSLLSDPKIMVKEVAARCGFSSTSTFSRAFRQSLGVTPREFRERMMQ